MAKLNDCLTEELTTDQVIGTYYGQGVIFPVGVLGFPTGIF